MYDQNFSVIFIMMIYETAVSPVCRNTRKQTPPKSNTMIAFRECFAFTFQIACPARESCFLMPFDRYIPLVAAKAAPALEISLPGNEHHPLVHKNEAVVGALHDDMPLCITGLRYRTGCAVNRCGKVQRLPSQLWMILRPQSEI